MTAYQDLHEAESGDCGSPAGGGWVQDLVIELKRSMPPGGLLGLDLAADDRLLELRYLRVSIGHRGDGHATRVLARLCAEADARGLVLACTPTDEFGADRTRLEAFYRRHGYAPADPDNRLSEHTWQRPRTATEESAS